eukprot:gnl/MRDRNA2_/MRDRNA2_127969_c0_seq1.p1 gnl/MRDRNA2_/MRDRNA2_127969_c0~~gnl/MRDRNA2_/MRDRNA2_127969_c0_seq1.p1  ORF type:complete len:427 (+),score=101.06 gnl/MRDRNA2_/MRDRNA2_127969_c0_seq1:122-1402(+)
MVKEFKAMKKKVMQIKRKEIGKKGFVAKKAERGQGLKFKLETYQTVSAFTPGTRIQYQQNNPKTLGSKSYTRYEKYKKAKTVGEAMVAGAKVADFSWELERGFYKILGPCRSEAAEIKKLGKKAYEKASSKLKFNGPHGLAFSLNDPRAKEMLAKEEQWRAERIARCEVKARELNLKTETARQLEESTESKDVRLQRRVADKMAENFLQAAGKEKRRITEAEVEAVLEHWGFYENIGRLNVMPEGQKYVYSDTVGAIKRRTGEWGMTPPTQRYPNFVRLLTEWLKGTKTGLKARFVCTAININGNYAGKRHRDANNEGPSVIRAFGKFSGGRLRYWPEDRKGTGKVEMLKESDSVAYDIKKHTKVFDGNRAHEVEPFHGGNRYSLVFFTARGFEKLGKEQVKIMKETMGFPWPTPQEVSELRKDSV